MIKVLLLAAFAFQQPSDEDIRKMAANVTDYPTKFALAKIGRPAMAALFDNFGSKDEWVVFESKSAIRWIVTYEKDRKALVDALAAFTAPKFSDGVRRFAVEMLGENGSAAGVEALTKLLEDPATAEAAVDALRRIPGREAGDALAGDALRLAKTPEFTRRVLQAIGARRDPTLTCVLKADVEFPEIRDAALEALGDCGDEAAVSTLADWAKKGSAAAHAGLLKHGRGKLAYELASTDDQRIAALAVCDDFGTIEAASKNETTREAAFAAMLRSDQHTDVKRILQESKCEANLMAALARARKPDAELVATFLRHESARVRMQAVMSLRGLPGEAATGALLGAEPTPLIVDALGARRDPAAIPALAKLVSGGDRDLKRAAVRALGAIGTADAAEALEGAAKAGDAEAVEAFVGVAEKVGRPELLHRALEFGAGDRALAALARVGTIDSVPAVEAAIERHRDAALACLVAIADRAKKDDALKVYKRASELGADVDAKLRALGERIEITARDGKIADWWVIGPFDAPNEASWTKPEAPEKEIDLSKTYGDLKWQPIAGRGETGVVDLDAFYKKNDNVVAYAFAEITLKKEHAGFLLCGSDDGIVVWINGEKVHEKLVPRSLKIDEDKAPIKLKEGANTILVKITEGGGGWEFHLRLTDEEGRALKFKIR